MAKRVRPSNRDEYYGFDVSTEEGRTQYIQYVSQKNEDEEPKKYKNKTAAQREQEIQEADEFMRVIEMQSGADFSNALYVVFRSTIFWIMQIIIICLSSLATIWLMYHFGWLK